MTVRGKAVTAPELESAIAAGTHEALRHPRGAYSLAPLLFRDLGLHHSGLDPLQRLIVLADIAVAAHGQGGATLGTTAPRSSCPLERYLSNNTPHRGGYRLGKWIVEKLGSAEISIVKHVLELVHGVLLAGSIDFHEVKQGEVTSTHYGPGTDHPGVTGDHIPGQRLVFIVQVDMKVDLTTSEPDLVSCGELVGLRIPPPGPVAGVPIQWAPLLTEGDEPLLKHGDIDEDQKTGSNGRAKLVFTPRERSDPRIRRAAYRHGGGAAPARAAQASSRPSATTSAAWSRT